MREIGLNRENVDVLIAGGGVAGAAAAAALSPFDWNILMVEPDVSQGRRLAGELIHPPGIEGLRELGLLHPKAGLGAPVRGFAVFPANGAGRSMEVVLPYGEGHGHHRHGMAIEHNVLKDHLLAKARQMPGVTAWMGARVTAMEAEADGTFTAVVRRENRETRVHAKLVLGADGPLSQMRKLVGIAHQTQRYSGMMGIEVEDTHLPHAGYGNIFLNPAGVAYAYAIGEGRARVMFEILKGANSKESIRTHLRCFPRRFRVDIERVLATGKPLAAANSCIIPAGFTKGNVALIGDARGCCHPLTASGITAAVKDAVILRDALRESRLDIAVALRRYSRQCGRLQLTRRTLAEELREAFLAQTPEALLLSQCIFAYWRNNPTGRVRSMALLSTLDSSIFSLAAQYAMVALQAFRLLPRWFRDEALGAWLKGLLKLFLKSLAFQHTAVRLWLKERVTFAR